MAPKAAIPIDPVLQALTTQLESLLHTEGSHGPLVDQAVFTAQLYAGSRSLAAMKANVNVAEVVATCVLDWQRYRRPEVSGAAQ